MRNLLKQAKELKEKTHTDSERERETALSSFRHFQAVAVKVLHSISL